MMTKLCGFVSLSFSSIVSWENKRVSNRGKHLLKKKRNNVGRIFNALLKFVMLLYINICNRLLYRR